MAKKPKNHQVTWAGAARDIFIASINKGQLPVLGVILGIFFIIYKMPPDDISKLVFKLYNDLLNYYLVSYVFTPLALVGWFVHAKLMRKKFHAELKRIGIEKSKLQSNKVAIKFKSSEK